MSVSNQVTSPDGVTTMVVALNDSVAERNLYNHTVQIEQGTGTSGTIAINGKIKGATTFQSLGLTPINLGSPTIIAFNGVFDELEFVPTTVNGTFIVNVASTTNS